MEQIRLNKYLSDTGVCSRREADRLTESGRITINGRKAELGEKISGKERICLDGRPVRPAPADRERVVLAVHKPRGIVCTTVENCHEKHSIVGMVGYPSRIYPIGRLDKDSEGLILMTDDGALVNRIPVSYTHLTGNRVIFMVRVAELGLKAFAASLQLVCLNDAVSGVLIQKQINISVRSV